MKRLALALFLIACDKQSEPAKTSAPPAPPPAPPAKVDPAPAGTPAPKPTPPATVAKSADERAKQLLDGQLAALKSGGDDIIKTFTDDAVVLVPDAREAKTPDRGLREAITRMSPHFQLKDIRVAKVVAGGNADAVWLSGELAIVSHGNEEGEKEHDAKTTVRVTELATAKSGWKVVAGAFSESSRPMMSKQAPGAIPGATEAGPLAPLLAAPAKLDAALSSDASVAVFGTDENERAYGASAAHALLGKWKALDLALEGKPREVRDAAWGFALANVNYQKKGAKFPSRMAGLLVAVPGAGGTWAVVAVQYTSI